MLPVAFFRCFWVTFIGLMGLLGIALAMAAGRLFALGSLVDGAVATILAGVCGLLCGAADVTYRSLTADR